MQGWGTDLVAATLLAYGQQQQRDDFAHTAALLAAYVEEAHHDQEPDLLSRLQYLLAASKHSHNPVEQRVLTRYRHWCRQLSTQPQTQLADKQVVAELMLAALPLRFSKTAEWQAVECAH